MWSTTSEQTTTKHLSKLMNQRLNKISKTVHITNWSLNLISLRNKLRRRMSQSNYIMTFSVKILKRRQRRQVSRIIQTPNFLSKGVQIWMKKNTMMRKLMVKMRKIRIWIILTMKNYIASLINCTHEKMRMSKEF